MTPMITLLECNERFARTRSPGRSAPKPVIFLDNPGEIIDAQLTAAGVPHQRVRRTHTTAASR